MRVLVVGDPDDDDAGHVGAALLDTGGRLDPLNRDDLPGWADVHGADLLLLLGSGRSVADPAQRPRVEAEVALVRAALSDAVPVLGICYGSQLLAHALGGTVTAAPHVELGWMSHDSLHPTLCPPGPWLQFHGDTFTVPPGARLLGSSSAGPQGMAWEGAAAAGQPVRALGWQFHPEVTPAVLDIWLRVDSAYVQRHGDREVLLADTRRLADQAGEAARRLTEAALGWLTGRQVMAIGGSTGS
jgi:GMP synthase-like glutamine amidotransferase